MGAMGKMARKALSKKVRFEVFKRDSFKCQYCGKSAPEVILHVDHIKPVAAGGTNDLLNLVTACVDCNSGKGATELSDHSVAAKQMRQLAEMNERREQIKLIAKWHEDLGSIASDEVLVFEREFRKTVGCGFSEKGRRDAKDTIKKYGLSLVLDSLTKSVRQYYRDDDKDSVEKVFDYVPRICFWTKKEQDNPWMAQVNLTCAIAQKYWFTCYRARLFNLCVDAVNNCGVDPTDLPSLARSSTGIMMFERGLNDLIEAGRGDGKASD